MLNAVSLAFEVTWDPGLRGILIVAVGITVLMGSVYLLLATNLGSRLGFLVAVAGLSGWMALMGLVWAMYGIGYKGTAPHWVVEEVVTSQSASDTSAAHLAKAHDLSTWRELPADDPSRGEAQATASAALITEGSRVKLFTADGDFKVIDAFTTGGKKVSKHVSWHRPFGDKGFSGWLEGWIPGPHPPHYSAIQVQAIEVVAVPFGETPPPPKVNSSAPVQTVIMVRDQGKLRVPPVLIMLASMIVFGVTCSTLHRRDKASWAARAAAGV
ncbi:MAG: hypothetical protein JWO68_909 [Actinomycetia bacterium]|nr:hypothetical protein [Actinomycetes bacterium]